MTLQAQWGLEKTADSAISISRGLLQAATSDNVQPLAIMACERFGNTLALCPETCRKVEKTVLPTPPHAVLKFLQGTVGYSPNDGATYFGTSQAGLQFLSFATALVGTMDTLQSAKRIHHLLVDSAPDKSLVPTLLQVEDLIESLEPRCHLSSFTDEVIGWQGLFRDLASEYDKSFARGVGYCDNGVPDAVALKSIVDAFRELSRIGNSGAVRVTFTTLSLVPWLIAFTKWCLGSPPSTYMEGGTPLMETADSKVRIQVLRTDHPSRQLLEITLEYSIGSPRDLASGAARGTWVGMVGLRTYCQWLLRDLNVGRGSALTAVKSAIAAAVKEAVGNISFVAIDKSSNEGGKELKTDTRRKFRDLSLQPLRDTSHVLSLMFKDYDSSDRPSDRLSILQIPAVRIHCRSSHVEPGKAIDDADEEIAFQERCFLWTLVEIVAVVLALSLYQHPESLSIFSIGLLDNPGTYTIRNKIWRALVSGEKVSHPSRLLLDEAMNLAGHYKGRISANCPVVMSSFSGQTVYFSFLETTTLINRGCMSLSWLPGVIWHGADKHHLVQSERDSNGRFGPDPGMVRVEKPLNLLQGASLRWVVERDGRRRGLRLSVAIEGFKARYKMWHRGVGGVSSSLVESVVLETCPHDKNGSIDAALAARCRYHLPGDQIQEYNFLGGNFGFPEDGDHFGIIHIVAVDGNDALRFYSCADLDGWPAVFRVEACLNCCVEVCIEADFRFVIL